MERGFFGVAIYKSKNSTNVGTLFRTSCILGGKYTAAIGSRFPKQCTDTVKSWKHIPSFEFDSFDEFYARLPHGAKLIGVEMCEKATDLANFVHPDQAIYLMGAEDHGLPEAILNKCHGLIKLRGEFSMNVSVAGSIVLYHRTSLHSATRQSSD